LRAQAGTTTWITADCDGNTRQARKGAKLRKLLNRLLLRMLLFRQESGDFLAEGLGVRRSRVFGGDSPLPVQQKYDRQSQYSSVGLAGLRISHDHGIIHVESPVEVTDGLGSVVHRNTDDLQAAVRVLLLKFDKMWSLLAARNTPGCPEVEQHDFAAIGREL